MGFRTLVRAGVVATLTTYSTANPTLLRKVWTGRPGSLSIGELPCAWIDAVDAERIPHANGIRQSQLVARVTFADVVPDGPEAEARSDILIDAILDALTADYHSAGGNSITEPRAYAERLVSEGPVPYLAVDIEVLAYVAEGRA
jgi:hypothetical protein